MRIPAECPQCREVAERRASLRDVNSRPEPLPVRTLPLSALPEAEVHSGKLTVRCDQGHETSVSMPVPDFELLFDFGCGALLDGYAREAITSFACSLERFQEFACRFLLAKREKPGGVLLSAEGIEAWWKAVASSSERQFGSFVALWISEYRDSPPALAPKLVELRNKCVHKGYIPPDEQARKYGEAVLRAMLSGLVRFRNSFDSDLEYDDFIDERVLQRPDDEPYVASLLTSSVISGMWRPNEPPTEDARGDRKNSTKPSEVTIAVALATFEQMRALGIR